MWGNTTGWLISAALGALMSWLLYVVAMPPSPTAPTNAAIMMVAQKKVTLPVPADTVAKPGNGDGDAGSFYRKAIDDYQLTRRTYENFKTRPTSVPVKDLTALDDILKARDCQNCNLFLSKPSDIINYESDQPALDALFDVGNICCTLGKLYTNEKFNKKTQPDKARQLWEAAFILGVNMYNERLTWAELVDGHGLMAAAGENLRKYYTDIKKDPARADAIQAFLDAESSYQQKLNDAFKIIGGVDEGFSGPYAGDIFAIANNEAADRMWRVEAIKHIGRYRFNSATMGDQLTSRKVVTKLLDDPNPVIKAAANAAHDLTVEKYHTFG